MPKLFELDYMDIPIAELPDGGGVIVCLDPKNRLRDSETKVTWAAVRTFDNKIAPPEPLAMFWDKDMALDYASFREDAP